jgi:hypothetical protein
VLGFLNIPHLQQATTSSLSGSPGQSGSDRSLGQLGINRTSTAGGPGGPNYPLPPANPLVPGYWEGAKAGEKWSPGPGLPQLQWVAGRGWVAVPGKADKTPYIDPSQYQVGGADLTSAVAPPGMPGVGSGPTAPGGQYPGMAPGSAGPMGPLQRGYNAFGQPKGFGAYEVDPAAVYSAESTELRAKDTLEQSRLHLLILEKQGNATQEELLSARNRVAEDERSFYESQFKYQESLQGKWKDASSKLSSGMGQIGAALDKDLGISKGLPGLADNLVKFLANLAAAPLLGPLAAIAAASPSQGGYGAIGIAGAQGAFGPQFTGIPGAAGMPTMGAGTFGLSPNAVPGALQPFGGGRGPGIPGAFGGYTSDAALLANVPAGRYDGTAGTADLTKGLGDCSSAVEDLVNLMDGRPTAGRSMSTGNEAQWLTERGFLPGSMPGAFNVGFNSEHAQATLPGGTPFNWGSDSAAANRGIGGSGASDPAFTSHYYRPVSAPSGGAAPSAMGPAGAPAAPTSLGDLLAQGLPYGAGPGSQSPMVGFGGGGGVPPVGIGSAAAAGPGSPFDPGGALGAVPTLGPQLGGIGQSGAQAAGPMGWGHAAAAPPGAAAGAGAPSIGTGPGTQLGGIEPPSNKGGGGIGITPGGTIDTAISLAAAAFPGVGQAAQTAIKLGNRAIQYGGQVGATLASGWMETFLPTGASELANKNWATRLLGAAAGASPQLPNMAGRPASAPQSQQGQQGQQGDQTGPVNNGVQIMGDYHQHGSEDAASKDLASHQVAANARPGT